MLAGLLAIFQINQHQFVKERRLVFRRQAINENCDLWPLAP